MKTRFGLACFVLLTLLLATLAPAAAQYPAKGTPIMIIVGYPPGGATDTAARLLAGGLEAELGTPVQVVNRPGAASQIGMTQLMNAKPDGYTVGYGVLPTMATHYLDPQRDAPYTRKNFTTVGLHYVIPQMLAVQASSRYQTLKDLIEAAKAAPERITVGDSGLLGTPHISMMLLEQAAGVRFNSVHFDGGAPSITALLGGHIEGLAGGIPDAVVNFRSGKFRVLGVADDRPNDLLPGAPTMKSQGYDVSMAAAAGVLAPAGTPKEIVDTLTAAMKKIIAGEAHQKRLMDIGITPRYLNPEEHAAFWANQEDRLGPLLKAVRAKK